jgi:hypothetical protein
MGFDCVGRGSELSHNVEVASKKGSRLGLNRVPPESITSPSMMGMVVAILSMADVTAVSPLRKKVQKCVDGYENQKPKRGLLRWTPKTGQVVKLQSGS